MVSGVTGTWLLGRDTDINNIPSTSNENDGRGLDPIFRF